MSSKGYLLIDINNLGFAAQSKTKLTANGMEVQAVFGVLRSVRAIINQYPMLKPLILHDGNTWRKGVFSEYKGTREKDPDAVLKKYEVKQQQNRDAYKAQKPLIKRAFKTLGVTQISAFNMEADDLAAILIRRYQPQGKKILMISADRDWLQLVGPGVGWRDPINNTFAKATNFREIAGVDTPQQFLEMKAFVGDVGDNVPGVDGIGKKGAIDFLDTYGSVANFTSMYLDGTLDLAKIPKKFRDFATDESKWEQFRTAMMLMDLNSPHIPAPINLKVDKGNLDHSEFVGLCRELAFSSIIRQMPVWTEPFERKAA